MISFVFFKIEQEAKKETPNNSKILYADFFIIKPVNPMVQIKTRAKLGQAKDLSKKTVIQ